MDSIWPRPNLAPFLQLAHYEQGWHPHWPSFAQLNAALGQAMRETGLESQPQFLPQDAQLAGDGLHYEQRIAEGVIATRQHCLHDYYSALAWLRFPAVKLAINRIHCLDIARLGPKQRSRHQQAMTHLDEAGAFMVSSDLGLLRMLDAHLWTQAFFLHREAWGEQIEARLFGHAVYELMHQPQRLQACKVIKILVQPEYFALTDAQKDRFLDSAIAASLLAHEQGADPKLQATVPVSGVPAWTTETQDAEFYFSAPCFRPKPEGRKYHDFLDLKSLS